MSTFHTSEAINSFNERLEAELKQAFSDDTQFTFREIHKNNDQIYAAVIISQPGNNIAPTIYTDMFMDKYEAGTEFSEIVSRIKEIYEKNKTDESLLDIRPIMNALNEGNFSSVENLVIYQMINESRNKDLLSDVPHRHVADDLAIVYRVFLEIKGDEEEPVQGTILIHNAHMESMNTTEEALYKASMKNTELLPPTIQPMSEMMKSFGADPKTMAELKEIYVVTNMSKHFGAGAALNKEFMDMAVKKLGGSVTVFPSSIHEMIVVPDSFFADSSVSGFSEMIKGVNAHIVASEEVLAEQPYHYDIERGFESLKAFNDYIESKRVDEKFDKAVSVDTIKPAETGAPNSVVKEASFSMKI